ncbi:hypothetical protein DC3_51110 [Deinococcus cellulosilyticus NBRC 106333 = KACC 11606]|uniref:Uncharacterized protein n=1 Tax=Deinococcus cellulosilyticus (strain DSM 18568 / NBRC 106333 / KACC 11606 / 5516J-15) TaxID=1223518 RepID=A0A511NAB2_DEIC1|nr:hypothetical protein DC3_51110 [Deinococcus cellulosilyticus NBRC 106333 = KACC 11606]
MWEWADDSTEQEFFAVNRSMHDRKGPEFPAVCPSCGQQSMHWYCYISRPQKGSVWVWCHSCHQYVHFTGLVPEQWEDLKDLDLTNGLTLDLLNQERDRIDKQVDKFLQS